MPSSLKPKNFQHLLGTWTFFRSHHGLHLLCWLYQSSIKNHSCVLTLPVRCCFWLSGCFSFQQVTSCHFVSEKVEMSLTEAVVSISPSDVLCGALLLFFRSSTDPNQIPSTIWEAECTSDSCSALWPGQPDAHRLNSVPIWQAILVLIRNNGSRFYTATYRSVAVGCTCVRARTTQSWAAKQQPGIQSRGQHHQRCAERMWMCFSFKCFFFNFSLKSFPMR